VVHSEIGAHTKGVHQVSRLCLKTETATGCCNVALL